MPVVVSLLRGVNVGGHHKIKMDALRALYESIGLHDVRTYIQSGNVIFRTAKKNLALVGKGVEDEIERQYGFRPDVILRTVAELEAVISGNPFAARTEIHPSKLVVNFLARDPAAEAREKLDALKADPEELVLAGRELFIHFPNGMGVSKLQFAAIDRALKMRGTARNWNTVMKLLQVAESIGP